MKDVNKYSIASWKTTACLILLMLLSVGIFSYSIKTAARPSIDAIAANDASIKFEVFRRFDIWVGRYLSGNFTNAAEFVQSGERLAVERRRLFGQLIKQNPQAAIEKSVSEKILQQLPQSVARFLEKSVSANGDFNVYAIDSSDSLEVGESPHRIEREVVIGNFRYKAVVYGRKAGMTTKIDIPLRGIVLDDLMAVDENSVKIIKPDSYAMRRVESSKPDEKTVVAEIGGNLHYFSGQREFDKSVKDLTDWEAKIAPVRTDNLSSWTEGAKELLLIRVDFPDNPGVPVDRFGQPFTESAAQTLIDDAVNRFYVSSSYGKTSLRAKVTPIVRMPNPQTFYTPDNLNALLDDARNAARAAGFDTNNYHLDMVAFSQSALLNFSGISAVGNKGALLNGSFTFKTTAHELGHEYGLLHAGLWRTFDGTITGNGNAVEYGDDFDMMGRGAAQTTHFNADFKRSLDWLTEKNVQTVTRPGIYRVFAFDTPTLMPQSIRALKIKRDETKDFWIEFRQLLTDFPNLMNGALIHWDFPLNGRRLTQLLDMQPSTTSLDDSSLLIGKTFTDEASGTTITVLGKGNTMPESLDIKIDFNFSVRNGASFDFDGDNKSDIGVFRPLNGTWYLNRSAQGFNAVNYGSASDIIVPAKFDADRLTDLAVYRNGTWYVHGSLGGDLAVRFGAAGDIPVPADYDGDGLAEMTVYRPSNGTWYLWNWNAQRFSAVQFGADGDQPVPADYDGDGKTDIAVFRPSSGVWHILHSGSGYSAVRFGVSEDKPVAADYDGDGKADIAVFRPSNGAWYLLRSSDGFTGINWGLATDIPVPADYDGDGKSDIAVFRPANGAWYRSNSSNGNYVFEQFGGGSDLPISMINNR